MDEVERLLRLLALNDDESVRRALAADADRGISEERLSDKVDLLVQLGALLALGAATASLRRTVDRALDAGASEAEIADVLISVAPALGLARVVAAAPRLAVALGYELGYDE